VPQGECRTRKQKSKWGRKGQKIRQKERKTMGREKEVRKKRLTGTITGLDEHCKATGRPERRGGKMEFCRGRESQRGPLGRCYRGLFISVVKPGAPQSASEKKKRLQKEENAPITGFSESKRILHKSGKKEHPAEKGKC